MCQSNQAGGWTADEDGAGSRDYLGTTTGLGVHRRPSGPLGRDRSDGIP